MEGSPRRTLWRAQEDRPADAGHKRKPGHHGPDDQFVHAFAAHPQCTADHLPGLRPRIALSVPGPLSGARQTFSRSLRAYDDSYPSDRTHAVRRSQGHRFAYRRFGKASGVPLVFNMHFTGTMEHWDPLVTDGFAKDREVILFDNAGVSSSSGEVPTSVERMAANALAFIKALGLSQVDVL